MPQKILKFDLKLKQDTRTVYCTILIKVEKFQGI